ncbi:MAG: putative MAPEG superfamily protein [Hyphomicrobiaceae bacterium]|jgi:uncharacterized MAPEG superfamily protein
MNEILQDPTFSLYAICSLVLALKMLALGAGTGVVRIVRGNYISPEDYSTFGTTPAAAPDPLIERLRRAHQNDLENIIPFFVIGALYALSGPSYNTAWWLFTTFTAFRVLHTITYAAGLQPWRTIVFEGANIANFILAFLALASLL